jgi:hypothetical protein
MPHRSWSPATGLLQNLVERFGVVPLLATMLAGGLLLNQLMKPSNAAVVDPAMKVKSRYSPPLWQIFVDSAQNTLLKDQSSGAGLSMPVAADLRIPYETTKRDLHAEQMASPGVGLVASAVVREEAKVF